MAICGSDGTSPPVPIGHPRHRLLLLDATRHGSRIETQRWAGDQVMQSLEKTPKRVWKSDKSINSPSTQSTTQQGGGLSEHRPLKVQSGIAAGQPIRMLGLCTEQAFLLLPSQNAGGG